MKRDYDDSHPFYDIIDDIESVRLNKASYIILKCSNLQQETEVLEVLEQNNLINLIKLKS